VLILVAIFFKAYGAIPLCLCAMALSVLHFQPYLPRPQPDASGAALKILQANVLKSNRDPDLLRRLIAEEQPDIISCCEVNAELAAMLQGLTPEYPHQFITTGNGESRIAVLSRLPFLKCEQTTFGDARTEAVVFRVELGGKPVDAVSLHPFTPTANIRARD